MPHQHISDISRIQKVSGYSFSILASMMVLASAIFKFKGEANIILILSELGLTEYSYLIGWVEILIIALYWIPKTSNFGFFLFCSYIGAITVAEIIMGDSPIPGLSIGILIYLGTFLRKPNLFIA